MIIFRTNGDLENEEETDFPDFAYSPTFLEIKRNIMDQHQSPKIRRNYSEDRDAARKNPRLNLFSTVL